MDRELNIFKFRFIINTSILLIFCSGLYFFYLKYEDTLFQFNFISGWVLFVIILFLHLFNIRKMVPFLPLGKMTLWMQSHIYVGIFSIIIFIIHLDGNLPGGVIGLILTGMFLLLFFGGLFGLVIYTLFPRRLTIRGEEVIFERIPAIRDAIKDKIKNLIVRSFMVAESTSISAFHQQKLKKYLDGPKDFWHHVLNLNKPYGDIRYMMDGLERYLNDEEKEIFREIRELVLIKTNLDFHYAGQKLLRYWLFFHIPVSYLIILVATLHLIIAYAFTGDM